MDSPPPDSAVPKVGPKGAVLAASFPTMTYATVCNEPVNNENCAICLSTSLSCHNFFYTRTFFPGSEISREVFASSLEQHLPFIAGLMSLPHCFYAQEKKIKNPANIVKLIPLPYHHAPLETIWPMTNRE